MIWFCFFPRTMSRFTLREYVHKKCRSVEKYIYINTEPPMLAQSNLVCNSCFMTILQLIPVEHYLQYNIGYRVMWKQSSRTLFIPIYYMCAHTRVILRTRGLGILICDAMVSRNKNNLSLGEYHSGLRVQVTVRMPLFTPAPMFHQIWIGPLDKRSPLVICNLIYLDAL